jgi:hypothetical protein
LTWGRVSRSHQPRLILGTLLATRSRRRWLGQALFLASLAATLLLFGHHATSRLPLNF